MNKPAPLLFSGCSNMVQYTVQAAAFFEDEAAVDALCKSLGHWLFEPASQAFDEWRDEEEGRGGSADLRIVSAGSSMTDTGSSKEHLGTRPLASEHTTGSSTAQVPKLSGDQKPSHPEALQRQASKHAAGLPLVAGHSAAASDAFRGAPANQNVRASYCVQNSAAVCICCHRVDVSILGMFANHTVLELDFEELMLLKRT